MTASTITRPDVHRVPVEQPDPRADRTSLARAAAIACFTGVGLSVAGALTLEVAAADPFGAMETTSRVDLAAQLDDVAGAMTALVVGLAIWLAAFPALAFGGVLLSRLGRNGVFARLSRFALTAATGAMPVFLVSMMTFVVVVAPAHAAGEDVLTLARTVGFAASTVDWLITALTLGIGPVALIVAGRDSWAPRWLQNCALVTAVVTIVELAALAAGQRDIAFVLVPVGLALYTAAGVAALRSAGAS
jgi:hypothetical protein